MRITTLIACGVVCLAGPHPASAQIGPSLVIEPWKPEPHWADTVDEPTFIEGGEARGTDEEIDIFYWDSFGRVKLDRHDPDPSFWFGYRVLAVDVDTELSELPPGLMDIAVVAAAKLGETDTWQWTVIGGAGTANDMHFSNSDAIYGIGNINASRALDEDRSLHIGLNYNGNRTFLPDVPLPYATYEHRVGDDLSYTLGVPQSGVTWRPIEPLTLTAQYTVPTNIHANASWHFTDSLSTFAEYAQTLDGFYIDEHDNRRLFYEWRRVAAGLRAQMSWLDARLGVGWAFDQEFSTGFDVRDLDTLVEPEDGLIFFLTLQGTF